MVMAIIAMSEREVCEQERMCGGWRGGRGCGA